MSRKASGAVLSVAALTLGLCVAEVIASYAFRQACFLDAIPHWVEEGWRLRWKNRGVEDSGVTQVGSDQYDSERGWTPKVNFQETTPHGFVRITTNSRGLRGSREFPYERTSGVRRVLFLGDSFTYGEEVTDEQTFPAIFASHRPGAEVLNLGVHGYGHDQMNLYFRKEGARYQADWLILGYASIDRYRNHLAFRDFSKPRFSLQGGALRLENSPVPNPEEVTLGLRRQWGLWSLISVFQGVLRGEPEKDESISPLTRAILADLVERARKGGVKVALLILPITPEEVAAQSGATETATRKFAEELSLPVISPRDRLKAELYDQKNAVFLRPHYSPDANRIIAEVISKEAVQLGF